jgi:protein-S-isoprenylcysteine O-methyltransferase Ste14
LPVLDERFADSNFGLAILNNESSLDQKGWGMIMSHYSAHKSRWVIGEVVFGIPFLVGIVLNFTIPFSLSLIIFRSVFIPVGIALVITGIGFISLARREFAFFSQPTDPGFPTSRIITTGVFGISRNPLYLGAVITLLGLALALNMLWALGMLVLSIIICHYVLIIPEERYLTVKFGQEYAEYTASVHRWLGRR